MLATLIIVFREIIEAGLVVGIILATTRGVPRRGLWVTYGIIAGAFGACLVALFADKIAGMMQGIGQEIFNASILIIAVFMLGWHNVWMARHGRTIAVEMKEIGAKVASGKRSLTALTVVVGVAVLREGSEIVLFLYGIIISGNETASSMLIGGLIGLALGALISALMYFGLLRIPARYLFSVTSWLISLLAAGMAAQAIGFLQQAGIINSLTHIVWDSSNILSNGSITGKALHTLIGYTDRPNQMQLIIYITTLVVIFILMKICKPAPYGSVK